MQPISIAVTTFNRFEWTIRAIEQIIDDERVGEVIISDDASPDGSGRRLADYYKGKDKVKVVIQANNRGMSLNKKISLSYATNDFALIGDSDNQFPIRYLDALFALGDLDKNTIYQPSKGLWNFDWTKYMGVKINKENIYAFMDDPLFRCSLNGCNYVVNPKLYCQRYKENKDIDAADTINFLYNWLLDGGNYFIVPGMEYYHSVHPESGFLKNLNKNMADAIALENKIKELR